MLNNFDASYHTLLKNILTNGEEREDRTGVGTIGLFGEQIKFDLRNGFPLLTTKKMAWKPVVSELLWFLEGSGDERRLAEILYGKPRAELADKKTIWTDNAKDKYPADGGVDGQSTGPIYGVQWRSWRVFTKDQVFLDQVKVLIDGLKNNPTSRRHIISAWNPGELQFMCLPPCHVMSQFYVNAQNELSCHMYQRSADVFLGVPFNIASYALLTQMIAQVCDFSVGNLIISFGDVHIYKNHVDQVKEQLTRTGFPPPTVYLNPMIYDIDKFTMKDIQLLKYECQPAIKAEMAV